jgi:hypothetical protein
VAALTGSSGKADTGPGGFDIAAQWLRHVAHVTQPTDPIISNGCGTAAGCRNGIAMIGSVVLDASDTTLTARFVDEFGTVHDQFSITR